MNTRVHVFFWIIVLSKYMPRSGIAESYDNFYYFIFREPLYYYVMTPPDCIPTNGIEGGPFLHTLSSICYLSIPP